MISLRLKTIASFVDPVDHLIDVGCDHAYLSIFLVQHHLCQNVLATDVHENALNNAKKNIQKEHLEEKITLLLSDGLEQVEQEKWDTLVLAGMGTNTIFHILSKVDSKYIKKVIVQSNHDLYTLRKKMPQYGYYLKEEKIIFEKKHYYVIGVYDLQKRKYNTRELLFGLYNFQYKAYYQHLYQKLKQRNQKISYKHLKEKILLGQKLYLLKKYFIKRK